MNTIKVYYRSSKMVLLCSTNLCFGSVNETKGIELVFQSSLYILSLQKFIDLECFCGLSGNLLNFYCVTDYNFHFFDDNKVRTDIPCQNTLPKSSTKITRILSFRNYIFSPFLHHFVQFRQGTYLVSD